jgi:hypothetical protein
MGSSIIIMWDERNVINCNSVRLEGARRHQTPDPWPSFVHLSQVGCIFIFVFLFLVIAITVNVGNKLFNMYINKFILMQLLHWTVIVSHFEIQNYPKYTLTLNEQYTSGRVSKSKAIPVTVTKVGKNTQHQWRRSKTATVSQLKLNFMVWVRERTIPTERPPLVGEVIANFCG